MIEKREKREKAAPAIVIARHAAELPVQRTASSGFFLMMLITIPAQTPLQAH